MVGITDHIQTVLSSLLLSRGLSKLCAVCRVSQEYLLLSLGNSLGVIKQFFLHKNGAENLLFL